MKLLAPIKIDTSSLSGVIAKLREIEALRAQFAELFVCRTGTPV